MARNSGARKIRSLAESVSSRANAAPAAASFASRQRSATQMADPSTALAMPQGTNSATPMVVYASSFRFEAQSMSAR